MFDVSEQHSYVHMLLGVINGMLMSKNPAARNIVCHLKFMQLIGQPQIWDESDNSVDGIAIS